MIKTTFFDSADTFLRETEAFLRQRPIEHNLPLTIADGLRGKNLATVDGAFLAAACDGGKICGVALRADRPKLVLSRSAPEVCAALAEAIFDRAPRQAAAFGPVPGITDFITAWQRRSGQTAKAGMRMRAFQLDRLQNTPAVAGELALATPAERETLAAWLAQFEAEVEATPSPTPVLARIDEQIAQQRLFLWRERGSGRPVSMAGYAGPFAGVCRVIAVYTPTEFRRCGYASAIVAALSRRLLDAGHQCSLFTDLANPTSNAIYQRLGYVPVCDFADFHLA